MKKELLLCLTEVNNNLAQTNRLVMALVNMKLHGSHSGLKADLLEEALRMKNKSIEMMLRVEAEIEKH